MFNKKILVLGNNTEDTNFQVDKLAKVNNTINHGLINLENNDTSKFGFYHTTIVDLPAGDIIKLAQEFDEVVLLDQEKNDYSHPKMFLTHYKLMVEIEKNSNRWSTKTQFRENKNISQFDKWREYLQKNKSFCIYPWIHFNNDQQGKLRTCARGKLFSSDSEKPYNWKNDKFLVNIRKKMLTGKSISENCKTCYQYESRGLTGYRIHDSLDWITKLGIEKLDDLEKIDNPFYYEIRLSNKCNLMCRMCSPDHSHLLKREFRKYPELELHKQTETPGYYYSDLDVINIESLTNKHIIYLTGGEPSVMSEVYEFLRRCIELKKTDFYLTIGTNAQNLNKTFLNLLSNFSQVHFSVSIDGYGKINDYIRWRSNWQDIIDNCVKIKKQGHQITWNHVPTIWGIHRTHELFEYVSEYFPYEDLYLQYNRVDLHCAFKSPLVDKVLYSMEQCMKTRLYWSDAKDCKSGIDAFYDHYQNYKPDPDHLKKFFQWNDTMDRARGIQLKDYIPELDEYRNFI